MCAEYSITLFSNPTITKYHYPAISLKIEQVLTCIECIMWRGTRVIHVSLSFRILARPSLVVQDADSLLPGVAFRMRQGVHEFYMKRPRRRARLARRAVRLPPPSLQLATVNLHESFLAQRLFRYFSKRRSPADVTFVFRLTLLCKLAKLKRWKRAIDSSYSI